MGTADCGAADMGPEVEAVIAPHGFRTPIVPLRVVQGFSSVWGHHGLTKLMLCPVVWVSDPRRGDRAVPPLLCPSEERCGLLIPRVVTGLCPSQFPADSCQLGAPGHPWTSASPGPLTPEPPRARADALREPSTVPAEHCGGNRPEGRRQRKRPCGETMVEPP